ncbi:MAG: hypothetical protein ACLPQS_15810 [Acidimicrobiales bacterium]
MPGEIYFVPTDSDGTQHHNDALTTWHLPTKSGDAWRPGDAIESDAGESLALLELDGLLDDLGERIFVAEKLPDAGGHERARLNSETDWTLRSAARFALDCVERVVPHPGGLTLPSGASVGDIFKAARDYLADDQQSSVGLLQRMSRIAATRRLRHLGDEIGDLAAAMTAEDEGKDLDALDDPAWTAVAALRDAVLAVVEAIRHDAFPKLFEDENRRYEADIDGGISPQVMTSPWGNFSIGGPGGAVPAWVAAGDAAERARQAMTETNGTEVGARYREWQLERLAQALGVPYAAGDDSAAV